MAKMRFFYGAFNLDDMRVFLNGRASSKADPKADLLDYKSPRRLQYRLTVKGLQAPENRKRAPINEQATHTKMITIEF